MAPIKKNIDFPVRLSSLHCDI